MNTTRNNLTSPPSEARLQRRSVAIALVMFALIGGFYLLREHWGHVAGYWPYLLLLACPVMHLFHHHGGHRGHAGHGNHGDPQATKNE